MYIMLILRLWNFDFSLFWQFPLDFPIKNDLPTPAPAHTRRGFVKNLSLIHEKYIKRLPFC